MLAIRQREPCWQSTKPGRAHWERGGLTFQVQLSQRGVAVPHPPRCLFVPPQLHGTLCQLGFYDTDPEMADVEKEMDKEKEKEKPSGTLVVRVMSCSGLRDS